MLERLITTEQAGAVYDILVEHAGAYADPEGREKWSFVQSVADQERPCPEYRFCGSLGFGGKFRNNGNRAGIPYVDCYREHETPERLAIIEKVNGLLAAIFRIRCGDHVHHGPSGETWVVAFADCETGDLAWCGWPDGIARLVNCTLTYRATDEEHAKLAREIAAGPSSARRACVRRLYPDLFQESTDAWRARAGRQRRDVHDGRDPRQAVFHAMLEEERN